MLQSSDQYVFLMNVVLVSLDSCSAPCLHTVRLDLVFNCCFQSIYIRHRLKAWRQPDTFLNLGKKMAKYKNTNNFHRYFEGIINHVSNASLWVVLLLYRGFEQF